VKAINFVVARPRLAN